MRVPSSRGYADLPRTKMPGDLAEKNLTVVRWKQEEVGGMIEIEMGMGMKVQMAMEMEMEIKMKMELNKTMMIMVQVDDGSEELEKLTEEAIAKEEEVRKSFYPASSRLPACLPASLLARSLARS